MTAAPDANRYVTPASERLLGALGVSFADPLEIEAVLWLHAASRSTPATRAVQAELGDHGVPADWIASALAMRGVK